MTSLSQWACFPIRRAAAGSGERTVIRVTSNSQAIPDRVRLFGVLVTYQRPQGLENSLRAIVAQEHQLEELVIVDNAPQTESTEIVRRFEGDLPRFSYIPSPMNLGPAGGRFLGTEAVLTRAADSDWVVFFDDDDPIPTSHLLGDLAAFIAFIKRTDPNAAGVGLRGARLDRRTGRVILVRSSESAIPVDHLHGNFYATYVVSALRSVGSFNPELFFGDEELELGLRLRRAGFSLYAASDLHRSVRHLMDPDPLARPGLPLAIPSLRRYYSLRNHLYILREENLAWQATSWALVAGVIKPVLWFPIHPKLAARHLRINITAIRDAFAERLGPRDWQDGRVTSVQKSNTLAEEADGQ